MMDSVKKNKALVSIIIFLLITNVGMLIFFLVVNNNSSVKTSHPRDGMAGMLQKDVGFSKQQLDAYQSLRKDQMDSVHALFDELKNSKLDFYNMIYLPQVDDSSLQLAAKKIADQQETLEIKMFNHFKTVRALCTPDQLPKFDSTLKKVVLRMVSRPVRDSHNNAAK